MEITEFGNGRKRSLNKNGQPYTNYHTLSNNAILPAPSTTLDPHQHTKHQPQIAKSSYLLPVLRPPQAP